MTRPFMFAATMLAALLARIPGAAADSVSFTDQWTDSAQSSAGVIKVVSQDTGTFSISLTVPGLSGLSDSELGQLTISASFGDITLPGDFTNSSTVSLTSLTSTQTEVDATGQTVTVGTVSISRNQNVATITGKVSNPLTAAPFPIFADQFLGTTGHIDVQKVFSISLSGPLTYSLQKNIYITGTGAVSLDTHGDTLDSVKIAGAANFTPPVLTFVSPAKNARLTNFDLTVQARATDTGSVTDVEFSLNNGLVQPGTPGQSNLWSTSFDLSAGPNTISAYAVDADGYVSATNTLTVQYIVVAPLALQSVGSGTISPNYSNAFLAVGNSYTMKAKAGKGFAFYYWSGGVPMSSNPTLNFTMTNGLVIIANFKDIAPPTVTITSPKSGEKYSNTVIQVTGTASDNVAVQSVGVRINNGEWQTADGTTAWSVDQLPVSSGANTVQAYAMDDAGNISATNTIKFTGDLPPPWAPSTLAGSALQITSASSQHLSASFDADTFSQTDTNATGDSGIGTYLYQSLDGSTNIYDLQLTFAAPPGLTNNNNPSDLLLIFTGPHIGNYTNLATFDNGTFAIATNASLLPSSWFKHSLDGTSALSAGALTVNLTSATRLTLTQSDATSTNNYVVTAASPVAALLTGTNSESGQVSYLQVTFTAKTSGRYEINNYDNTGNFQTSDLGTFTWH